MLGSSMALIDDDGFTIGSAMITDETEDSVFVETHEGKETDAFWMTKTEFNQRYGRKRPKRG